MPYSQMLERFNGFQTGAGWVDLRPSMRIQIENAYYEPGKPKRGLEGFIGTERLWYRKPPTAGLIEGAFEDKMLAARPAAETPTTQLVTAPQRAHDAYRLFFSIRVNRRGATRGAVMLGAPSQAALEARAAALLADPDSVCREGSPECVVFPEVCTVSPEIEVTVNGQLKVYTWATPLSAAAGKARSVKLTRMIEGKARTIPVDPADGNALRMPMLPGDEMQVN
ncbi:MAG: hypothetical protein IPJ98_27335 [Bryobacterales bacterium]|nr:hypothetical protein [Bryobacterales bacterium]